MSTETARLRWIINRRTGEIHDTRHLASQCQVGEIVDRYETDFLPSEEVDDYCWYCIGQHAKR